MDVEKSSAHDVGAVEMRDAGHTIPRTDTCIKTRGYVMRINHGIWAITILISIVTPLSGQTPQQLAAINKKVTGKWISADRKSYIDFSADGSCSTGFMGNEGHWHVAHHTLNVPWAQSDAFMCGGGTLELIGPNTLLRDYGMGGKPETFYRGATTLPPLPGPLTVAIAQQVLARQINSPTVNNTLFTCHACYDPSDKEDNDRAPLVSTYSSALTEYLIRNGYIRTIGDHQVFTAKAKRSRFYTASDGMAGLRIANLTDARVSVGTIADQKHVPIEYDITPTAITAGFFGTVQKVRSFARFTYENQAWRICLACQSQ